MPYDVYHIAEIEVTYSTREEAKKISFDLIEEKLIACATLTEVTSIFPWESKIGQGDEIKLTVKTLDKYVSEVRDMILVRHSYEIPMVLTTMKVINESYFRWMERVCGE